MDGENASGSTSFTLAGRVIDFNDGVLINAYFLIAVIPSFSVTEVRLLQPENAFAGIVPCRPLVVTEVRLMHSSKARSPMDVTPAGMSIVFSAVLRRNAADPIDVKVEGKTTVSTAEKLPRERLPICVMPCCSPI